MVPNHPGADHPLEFCPMLGESKHIQALMPVLPGRTWVSNHCPALAFPLLTPKLDSATGADGRDSGSVPRLEGVFSKLSIPETGWKLNLAPEDTHIRTRKKPPQPPRNLCSHQFLCKTNSSEGNNQKEHPSAPQCSRQDFFIFIKKPMICHLAN